VKVFSVEMRAEYFELGQSIFSQGDAADKFYVNSNSSHRSHKSWNRSQSSRELTAQCMSDVCVLSVGRGAYQRLKSIRANQTKQRTDYLQRRLKLPFFADHDRHTRLICDFWST
jgi:hypothetical protein